MSLIRAIGLGGKEYRLAVEEAFKSTSVDLDFPFSGIIIGKAMQAAKRAVASGNLNQQTER